METVYIQLDEDMLADIEIQADSLHLFSDEFCSLIIARALAVPLEDEKLLCDC